MNDKCTTKCHINCRKSTRGYNIRLRNYIVTKKLFYVIFLDIIYVIRSIGYLLTNRNKLHDTSPPDQFYTCNSYFCWTPSDSEDYMIID
jgi:hypothetical protein